MTSRVPTSATSATVINEQIIEEPHKGTRGGPSDPRLDPPAR